MTSSASLAATFAPGASARQAILRTEQGTDLAVYDHPYVKKLEAKVEKLEDTLNDTHVAHRQELMELQRANLVAISQNFGKYMLEMIGMKAMPSRVDEAPTPTDGEGQRTGGAN